MHKYAAHGGCHCGRIAFEVMLAETIVVQHCNCSMCRLVGFVHLITPAACFRLLRGGEHLREYRFNSATAQHLFCAYCGVKSYYVPRSNPDGFSVNLRCLDLPQGVRVIEENFDGQNWELNAEELHHLSEQSV